MIVKIVCFHRVMKFVVLDLKSWASLTRACRFESGPRHHFFKKNKCLRFYKKTQSFKTLGLFFAFAATVPPDVFFIIKTPGTFRLFHVKTPGTWWFLVAFFYFIFRIGITFCLEIPKETTPAFFSKNPGSKCAYFKVIMGFECPKRLCSSIRLPPFIT